MYHNLKLESCFAEAVNRGEKTFEIRYNKDRGFQTGDFITFSVVNEGVHINHPLNLAVFEITYVLSYYGLKEDYVAFSIKRADKEKNGDE